MSGYSAKITFNDFVRLNNPRPDSKNLLKLVASGNVSDPDNTMATLEFVAGESRVQLWADQLKMQTKDLPWEGTVTELDDEEWWVEGIETSCAQGDVWFKLTVKAGQPQDWPIANKTTTVMRPKIVVSSNIEEGKPDAPGEWQLAPDDVPEWVYEVDVLAGTRVRLLLTSEPAFTPSQIEMMSVVWDGAEAKFFDAYHLGATELNGTGRVDLFWQDPEWAENSPPSLPDEKKLEVDFTMLSAETDDPDTPMDKVVFVKARELYGQHPFVADDIRMLQEINIYLGFRLPVPDGEWWKYASKQGSRPRPDRKVGSDTGAAVIRFRKQNHGTWTSQDAKVDSLTARDYVRHHYDYRTARNDLGWNHNYTPSQPANSRISAQASEAQRLQIRSWIETAAPGLTHLHTGLVFSPTFMGNQVVPLNPTNRELFLVAIMDIESSYTHWGRVNDNDPEIPWIIRFSRTNSTDIGALGFIQMMPFNSLRYNVHGSIGKTVALYHPLGNLQAGCEYMNDGALAKVMKAGDEWIVFPDTLDETVAKAGFIYNGGNRIVTNGKAPGEPGYEFRWVAEEYSWQTILTKKGPDPWTGLEISLPVAQEQLDYGSLLMGRLGIGQ